MSDKLIKAMDTAYSARLIRLLRKPWVEWEAYKYGIINGQGELVRNPKTPAEKEVYSTFHRTVRTLKKRLNSVPYTNGFMNIKSSYDTLRARYNLTEQEHDEVLSSVPELMEAMVAGDAGGNPEKIASGVNSGSITNIAPEVLGQSKRKKKSEGK